MQVGRGVDVAAITTQFSSGSFETTANATDLAIDGDGFFIVKDADGGEYYTRAGAFHLDNNGYLVDVNSLKVQGYNITGTDPTEISIGSNLDAAEATGGTFNAAQTVYDSLGAVHSLKLTFQKTEGNGYWGFKSYLDNEAAGRVLSLMRTVFLRKCTKRQQRKRRSTMLIPPITILLAPARQK